MATYAVGDIQGCYRTLRKLLAQLGFEPRKDRLWLVGDLVNRGPRSADVLRYAQDLGERARVVLGNHDLHLIARAMGLAGAKSRDTLDDVLDANDGELLVRWLRQQPFVVYEPPNLMVHAGLLPAWTESEAVAIAQDLERVLRGPAATVLLRRDKDAPPADTWLEDAEPVQRRRTALAAMTRMRVCASPRVMRLDFTGAPGEAPEGCRPWFDFPSRRRQETRVVFGHWSTLGLRLQPGIAGLDTGCVWGRTLTAMRLEDGQVYEERYAE